MNDTVSSRWTFGGPLTGAPPDTAWTVLAMVAVLGAIVAWVSYRNSVRRLGLATCVVLMLLRTATLGLLLFCLANPVRIERSTSRLPDPPLPGPPPRLALVIDRSDSMTLVDNRGRSRFDDAMANWRRIEQTAHSYFSAVQFFSFAEDLQPAKTMDEARARTSGTGETRLYRAVATLLKKESGERPDVIVVLTDGMDTSDDSDALLRDAALAAGVPVYFVAGSNRAPPPEPFVRVRELRAPPTALRHNGFTVEASFEAFSRADRAVPFSLWQGTKRLLREELQLTMGPNLVTRSFPVSSGEPGAVDFTVRIGADDDAPIAARVSTHVLSPRLHKLRVLIFQSALDWGLRYFTSALRSDSTFEYFTVMTPDVGLAITSGSEPGSTMRGRLPDAAGPLTQFDCLVLVRTSPKRLSETQQKAVIDYVRGGGSVFFMSPDAEAMVQFEAAPLRTLLPIYLRDEKSDAPQGEKPLLDGTIDRITKPTAGGPPGAGTRLASFSLTETGRASPIFARAESSEDGPLRPRFLEYVTLNRPKPGADVLAVHPTGADDTSGQPHILLAMQNFGMGRSALLTTDTLWRWKLDEPSNSQVVETFWRQLLLAITGPGEKGLLRFANAPQLARIGKIATLRLGGLNVAGIPVVHAKGPGNRSIKMSVKRTDDPAAPWAVEWTPDVAGGWELIAEIDGAPQASTYIPVTPEGSGELAPGVPDLDALRALAGATGGALLSREAPSAWRKEGDLSNKQVEVASERMFPLWNRWKILSAALGCYALELVLRRAWKLL